MTGVAGRPDPPPRDGHTGGVVSAWPDPRLGEGGVEQAMARQSRHRGANEGVPLVMIEA